MEMDVHQKIQQDAFKRNQAFLEEKAYKDKMTEQAKKLFEENHEDEQTGDSNDLNLMRYIKLRKYQKR